MKPVSIPGPIKTVMHHMYVLLFYYFRENCHGSAKENIFWWRGLPGREHGTAVSWSSGSSWIVFHPSVPQGPLPGHGSHRNPSLHLCSCKPGQRTMGRRCGWYPANWDICRLYRPTVFRLSWDYLASATKAFIFKAHQSI